MKNSILHTTPTWAATLLRVILGGTMFAHGAQLLLGWFGGFGFAGSMQYLTTAAGLPWLVAVLVIGLQFFGSLLLVIGLGTRLMAIAMFFLFIGMILTSHLDYGFFMNWLGTQAGEGFEYHLLALGMCGALTVLGGGAYSLDGKLANARTYRTVQALRLTVMPFRLLLLLPVCLLSVRAMAQPIPLEAMAGHRYYWYQQVVARPFSPQSRVGFFHTSSLTIYYDRTQADEVMTQSYLTYRLFPFLTAALGTFYSTVPGFSPSFALQFSRRQEHLRMLIVPRIDLWKETSYEVMALLEYCPPISERVRLYSRLQLMSNHGAQGHNRSYQHVRAGLDLKTVQFGLAFNMDEYGQEVRTATNWGLFVRKEL